MRLSRIAYYVPALVRKQETRHAVGIRIGPWWLYVGAEALHLYRDHRLHGWLTLRGVRGW